VEEDLKKMRISGWKEGRLGEETNGNVLRDVKVVQGP
jgi:hypothetical protein